VYTHETKAQGEKRAQQRGAGGVRGGLAEGTPPAIGRPEAS